jgi:tRNA threonylcarbamoyladenosine biosynthesis protein TsaB
VILGIETSTSVSSVALAGDTGLIAQRQTQAGRGHVEFLTPAIQELLADNGATLRDISLVAVGLGPGLFTGMRVGIVTAKTIAQTLGIGVVGISSLDNLAHQARDVAGVVCACVDARRAEVFAAFYRDGVAATDPATFAPADLATHDAALFIGDGAVAYQDLLRPVRDAAPTAAVACELAAGRAPQDATHIEPLYIRRSEAEIKWQDRGVQPLRPDRVKIAGQR